MPGEPEDFSPNTASEASPFRENVANVCRVFRSEVLHEGSISEGGAAHGQPVQNAGSAVQSGTYRATLNRPSIRPMVPPMPWSRRFWHVPSRTPTSEVPDAEALRPDEVHTGGYVFSPGGWVAPRDSKPGWDWLPPQGAVERRDRAPGWVLCWLNLPLLDRWAESWLWSHGCYEVEPAATAPPPPPPGAGVREPRRPIPPRGTDPIRLPAPS